MYTCLPVPLLQVRPRQKKTKNKKPLLGPAYPAPTRPGAIICPPGPPAQLQPERAVPLRVTGCVVGRGRTRDRGLPASGTDLPPSSRAGVGPRPRARLGHPAGRSAFASAGPPPAGTPEPRGALALGGWKLMGPESSRRTLLTMAALGTKRGPPPSGTREKRVGGCARRSLKRSAQFRPFPEHRDSILPPAGGRS